MRIPLPASAFEAATPWFLRRAERRPYHDLPGYMLRGWWFGGSAPGRYDLDDPPRQWSAGLLDSWIGRIVACRVQTILRSDNDRHVHSHPWRYFSIILSGGYFEITLDRDGNELRRWCGPGTIVIGRRRHFHRLEVPEGTRCVTLFFMLGRVQRWGFFMDADEYQEHLAWLRANCPDAPLLRSHR